jgi:hypothetical protein
VPRDKLGECVGEGGTYDKKVDLPHSASPSNSTVISGVSMENCNSAAEAPECGDPTCQWLRCEVAAITANDDT